MFTFKIQLICDKLFNLIMIAINITGILMRSTFQSLVKLVKGSLKIPITLFTTNI